RESFQPVCALRYAAGRPSQRGVSGSPFMIAVGLVMALIAPNFLIRATERCVFGPVIDTPPIKSAEMNRASVPWAGSKTNFLDAREAGSVERTSWSARSCLPVVQRLLSTCHGTKLLGSSGCRVGKEPDHLGPGGPFSV